MTRPGIAIVGCGYVGTALGSRLSEDEQVRERYGALVGTTRGSAREPEITAAGLTPRRADTGDRASLRAAIDGCSVLYLTLAAGRGDDYRATYVDGMRAVLAACDGSSVERILYTSSSSVYGQTDGSWVDEDSVTEPTTGGGRVLLEAERALLDRSPALGIEATIVRLTGIYAADRGPQRRVALLADGERNDGNAYLNLIHVDDIVESLRRLLDVPYAGVLCLNDDEPTSRRAFYDHHIARAGLEPIRWLEPSGRPELGKRVKNARLKQLLRLELRHPRHLP